MEVGDYVRIDGEIGKLIKCPCFIKADYGNWLWAEFSLEQRLIREELIEKSSPNIIDLIEAGDVISYKDGSIARVIEIPYTNPNNHKYYLIKDIFGEQYYERDEWLLDNIRSILTKEQFESMEYKIC